MKGSRIGAGILISLLDLGIEGCGNDMIFNASSGNSLNLMDDNHITTREECVAHNGVWAMWNINDRYAGTYRCNLRANDSGKKCYDQNDCEGNCLTECFNAGCHSNYGTCTEFEFSYGCFRTWSNGKESVNIICLD